MVKNLPTNASDVCLFPASGRSPGGRNGNPFQYSCLGNPVDSGAGGLQSMGSQRVGCNLAAKQQQELGQLQKGVEAGDTS